MKTNLRALLLCIATAALVLPAAGAHHTAPDNSTTNVGIANCYTPPTSPTATTGNPFLAGIIRVTDNGKLTATLGGANQQSTGLACTFRISFTDTVNLHGANGFKEGGIDAHYDDVTCTAGPLQTCTASDSVDWWVTFLDSNRRKVTWGIDLHYDVFVTQGLLTTKVGSGFVTVYEPSVPEMGLP